MPVSSFRLALITTSAFALLTTGCATKETSSAAAAPQITPQTSLDDLSTVFLAKFPKASKLVSTDGFLKRTAQEFFDIPGANATAQDDFKRWCGFSRGTLHTGIEGGKGSSYEFGPAVKAAIDMFSMTTRLHVQSLDMAACEMNGQKHVLFSARASLTSGGGQQFRAIAWISADDLTRFGPLASRERAAEQRRDADQREKESASQRASKEQAEANRAALLDRSPKGTQIACNGRQYSDVSIGAMLFTCNGVGVFFADFAPRGWRITSQTTVPQVINGVPQGAEVNLIVEKVR